jgi:Tetratricopeptide repeat
VQKVNFNKKMKKIVSLLLTFLSLTAIAQNTTFQIDSLYTALKKAKTPAEQFDVWTDLKEYYTYRGQTDSSWYFAELLLSYATKSQEDSLLSTAYVHLGGYFGNNGDFKQSLEYKFKSLAYAEKANSPSKIWLATKEIAVDFKLLKNYNEALKYLRKAESRLNDFPSIDGTKYNRTYTHLAEVYLNLGQPDSALHYIQLTEKTTKKDNDAYGYARMLYIFATVYYAKGDEDLAESYYKKCISFSSLENIMVPYVNASTDYGKLLLTEDDLNVSKQFALAALKRAKESDYKLGVINASGLLRMVYEKLNIKDSAYYYADMKEAYRDSVFSEQQTNQIQNLSFSQQIKEKEDEAKVALELLQRNQNIQYALIALGIVTFLILFFLLSRSIIVTEKWISFFGILGLLIVFEFINLLIHPFLERVTHHSPFLMLMALVALASLLIPLHHRMEKWIKVKMTEKNKNIRLENAKKTIEQLAEK